MRFVVMAWPLSEESRSLTILVSSSSPNLHRQLSVPPPATHVRDRDVEMLDLLQKPKLCCKKASRRHNSSSFFIVIDSYSIQQCLDRSPSSSPLRLHHLPSNSLPRTMRQRQTERRCSSNFSPLGKRRNSCRRGSGIVVVDSGSELLFILWRRLFQRIPINP